MTTMARALEHDGLIERRIDPADARATLIFLTRRARRLRPVADQVLAELDAHVARALSERVRDSLKEGLRQIGALDRPESRGALDSPHESRAR
jgi:DNA-binding MarR family transcriptional regulator